MFSYIKDYDVIVVGAGHAGCEAALASARMGCSVLVLTINVDMIGHMPCNPAIGGLAKGQIVREIDALGGEMAIAADKTAIQFKMLNVTRGPAVHGPRAQSDRHQYKLYMKNVLQNQPGIDIKQEIVEKLCIQNGKVTGVITNLETEYKAKTVILTTGTFLKGLIHIGLNSFKAGRAGEFPSEKLSDSLIEAGFELGRLKTGTTPRLNTNSIDYSNLTPQYGDENPRPFSFSTEKLNLVQIPCYLTYTTTATHDIIRKNLDRSPLYRGKILGIGPRYCPSIEDKVVRFTDKERHHIFLEPEGKNDAEVYVNGLSTSLPVDVQIDLLHSIPGLEHAEIIRPGYAIEYDFCPPHQIKATLETKKIEGLYFAGQINGTSGYEEAAGQGLIAGINAALKIKNMDPFILDRSEAYIGVLIDDLITKGTQEPYRMFTSRAEYRLILRQDNADLRLMEKGFKIGLLSKDKYNQMIEKKSGIEKEMKRLQSIFIYPDKSDEFLKKYGYPPSKGKLELMTLLKRPDITYSVLGEINEESKKVNKLIAEQVEIEVKYTGYIERQNRQIEEFKKLETKKIPENIDYNQINGLPQEPKQKLNKIKPSNLGQASRISGVSPADITVLMIYLKNYEEK